MPTIGDEVYITDVERDILTVFINHDIMGKEPIIKTLEVLIEKMKL